MNSSIIHSHSNRSNFVSSELAKNYSGLILYCLVASVAPNFPLDAKGDGLPHKVSAINKNCLSRYITGFITCQEEYGADNVLGLSYSLKRDPFFFGIKFLVCHVASRLGGVG